jgi:hypothetical protein
MDPDRGLSRSIAEGTMRIWVVRRQTEFTILDTDEDLFIAGPFGESSGDPDDVNFDLILCEHPQSDYEWEFLIHVLRPLVGPTGQLQIYGGTEAALAVHRLPC